MFLDSYHNQTRFPQLMLLMLWAIMFFGVYAISQYYPDGMTYELPVLFVMIICGYSKVSKSKYKTWYTLFIIALITEYISSNYFEKAEITECIRTSSFTHYLFVFFPLALISPSINDIEKGIVWLGRIALVVYFVQYLLLPYPIVQSLAAGWRLTSSSEFDIVRFNVVGELIMFFYLFYSFDRYLKNSDKISLLPVSLVVLMCVLHGYRSWILAMVFCMLVQFFIRRGVKLSFKTIGFTLFTVMIIYVLSSLQVVQDVWEAMSDKNDNQFAAGRTFADLDRFIEFEYFYESRIQNVWEWMFGSGFLFGRADEGSFVNWVDLGFIGLSFTGGIFMTVCWLRLLLLNFSNKIDKEYLYLKIFTLFVLLGTLTLPLAFNDKAPAIQALALYLGYKLSSGNKTECLYDSINSDTCI